MKFQELYEGTFNVNKLVDKLYDFGFKKYIQQIDNYIDGHMNRPTPPHIHMSAMEFARFANDPFITESLEKNPVEIYLTVSKGGSSYNPNQQKIVMSFNIGVHDLVKTAVDNNIPYALLIDQIPAKQQQNFKQELLGHTVRGSIAHELSHWLDDTHHGFHLSKMTAARRRAEAEYNWDAVEKIIKKGREDVYLTFYEIDAQIHALKELKRGYTQEEWDRITFNGLMNLSPPTYSTYKRISPEDKKLFKKLLFKRMHREGILGKQMR